MASAAVLFLFTAGSVLGPAAAERRLEYVTVLFRHGDRSPIKTYPTNPNTESSWPQGLGQLSQEGMRQHFQLGQFLRTRYQNFLNESYDRHEIHVRSTDYDRTLMSAASTLAGLYPPSGRQVFMPGLKWQPVPIHTVSRREEKLLLYPMKHCPLYSQLMNETRSSEEYVNVTENYEDLFKLLRNKTRSDTSDLLMMSYLYDTLYCESLHNLPAPDWVTPAIIEDLKFIKDYVFQSLFGGYKRLEKSRLQGGVLLGEIVKNLSKMAVPSPKRRFKMMMLSSHDTAVAALQSSLDVYNGLTPPYAACQMIELHTDDDGSAWVSMFYRNDSSVPPYQLQLPGCSLDCPLEDFVRITKPSISEDRDKECRLPSGVEDEDLTNPQLSPHHRLHPHQPTPVTRLRRAPNQQQGMPTRKLEAGQKA
ncbi:prostatic acid phosphatase-like [Cololabis saira]|uniref:prostatic acid phosphatase-like n=1 Tax=Cololabis saira TaxID=129043 RepID=UPI002AD33ED2|nr:prostatic acid phosphatase-like [Cololabis saira]